jgi:transcriptional regulator with XRE-family HTH domain
VSAADSPAVARRRVRLAVREAREAAGLTQGQVAEAMEWSLSKVMRIESGEVTVALNDLKALLSYVRVTDPTTVAALLDSARAAKQRKMWWDEPRYREHLTPSLRQLIQYEVEATTIRGFSMTLIPGHLQTTEYATAILEKYSRDLSADDRAVRLETRLRRRDALVRSRNPPRQLALVDESVLHRQVGGPPVLLNQLKDLVRRSKEAATAIRVIPFTFDGPIPLYGSYELLDLDRSGEDSLLYRETHVTDELIEDPGVVGDHRQMFEETWNAALDEAQSADLIAARVEAIQRGPK